jgi:hypothetical protein
MEMQMMDIIKKKSKKVSNVVTVYLKDKDMESLEFLREKDVNISMVCRHAIRETAEKFMKKDDISDKQEIMCNGKIIINMEENKIILENKPFFNKNDFEID